jgi:hypothetical protein
MEPTETMVRRHIAEARRILQSDRVLAKLNKHFPDDPVDPGKGPPAPTPADPKEPPKQKSLWWGNNLPTE